MEDKSKVTLFKTAPEATRGRRGTRERLLDAGLKLFAQKGFAGTAISDLEVEAGLKPGTGSFYRHFSSKEEVLHEVIAREIERNHAIGDMYAAVTAGALGNARAELVLEFRLALMHLEQMRDFIQILIREEDLLREDAQHVHEVMIEAAHRREARKLEERIRAGQVIDLDPGALWGVIISALVGYVLAKRYFRVSNIAGMDDDKLVNTLADLLIRPRRE